YFGTVPSFTGHPATPQPIFGPPNRQHPFMAANGSSNIHVDASASDTHLPSGPLGNNPTLVSTRRAAFGGQCATIAFDRQQRIVTMSASLKRMQLLLLEPRTLRELAHYNLPQRPSSLAFRKLHPIDSIRKITSDTSGGGYFYLDQDDNVVIGTAARQIEV